MYENGVRGKGGGKDAKLRDVEGVKGTLSVARTLLFIIFTA